MFSQERFNDACDRVVKYTIKLRVEDDKAMHLDDTYVDWENYAGIVKDLDKANADLLREIDLLPEGLQANARDDAEMLQHIAAGWLIREAMVGGVYLTGFSPYQDWFANFLQETTNKARKAGAKEALLEAANHALRLAGA